MKRNGNAEVERRRCEDRGAEGVGRGEGVSPSPQGEGDGERPCPLPRKIFDFGSQYGEFWCILDGIFTVQLPVLNAKPEFNCYIGV